MTALFGYIAIGFGTISTIGTIANHILGRMDRGIQCEIVTVLWFILARLLLS